MQRIDQSRLGEMQKTWQPLTRAVSPDRQALISADDHGAVVIWNLNPSELLKQGCDRLHNYLTTNPNAQPSDRALCN